MLRTNRARRFEATLWAALPMVSAAWTTPALAQQQPAPAMRSAPDATATPTAPALTPDKAMEIVVTGSRIRGVRLVGSTSTSVGQDILDHATATNVADVLKQMPQFSGIGVNEATSAVQGINTSNITRGTAINLHGAGPAATLVLLDGQRMVASGQGGIYVDPSTIPAIALERVEIVADGGSSLYGSDAVAGVVNLILKKNFKGAQTSVRYGTAQGYDRLQISQLFGTTWTGGSVMLAYEHSYNSHLSGQKRDWYQSDLTARGGADYRSTFCNPGNVQTGGTYYTLPALTPGRNRCDLQKLADLLPQSKRDNMVLTATQQVSAGTTLFAEGYFSNRTFHLNNVPTGGQYTVPSTNAYYVSPTGSASEVAEYNFYKDFGNAKSSGYVRVASINAGARIELPHRWRLELSGMYGDDREVVRTDTVNNAALTSALASSTPATALNVFGGTNSASLVSGLYTGLFNPIFHNWTEGGAIRVDGPLFSLPAGAVRLATGAEFHHYGMYANTIRGTTSAPSAFEVTGSRNVTSVYAEAYIPIVAPDMDVPVINRLELSASGRYDHYSDVGDTANPKVGLNWQPVPDLTLKGSWGTSFRAPALSDIHNGSASVTVNTLADPLSSTGSSTGLVVSNFTSQLKPETATTASVGGEFKPHGLPGLKLSGSYFWLNYNNQVTTPTTPLSQPALYPGLITRNPTSAQVAALLATGLPFSGTMPPTVAFILNNSKANLASTLIRGFDFSAEYSFKLASGRMRLGVDGTKFTDYETQLTPQAAFVSRLNYINYVLAFRARPYLQWTNGPVFAGAAVNYTNGYKNNLVTPVQNVSAFTTVDLQFSYTMPDSAGFALKGLRLGVDASNILNTIPPFVNQIGGYDPGATSPVGRIVTVSLSKTW